MRHAAAEPGGPGQPDVQRRLTPAGRERAAAQAAVIAANPPQVVLCSAAARATETLTHLGVDQAAVHVEPGLYEASGTGVLLRLAEIPSDVETVLLIGHMPTVATVAGALVADPTPGEDSAAAVDRLRTRGFSPGSVAVLDLPAPWDALQPASARLRHFR